MRLRVVLYLVIFVVMVGGIFAYQYWNFRMPDQSPAQDYDHSLRETDGVKHTVDLSDIVSGGVPQDNIPSIDAPEFEGMLAADVYLKDDGYGIDLEINGEHRFYPYQLLVWHEIVNDIFNDVPVLITYCPLCESSVVFDRRIGDELVEFGTSGRLWNNNLVMYDRKTDTLWSQILDQGIVGELAGRRLERIPTQVMTWDAWKRAYPDGEVLTRETGAERDYTRDPYGDYYKNSDIKFALTNKDARLPVKERVFGVLTANGQGAYLQKAMAEEKFVIEEIGGQKVEIVYNEETGGVEAHSANQPIVVIPAFWFCWVAAYPNTNLHLP